MLSMAVFSWTLLIPAKCSLGQYSAKSAYDGILACFLVWCSSDLGKESGKTWAPAKCKFFMWLVAYNRCWTADCLARSLKVAFLIMSIASVWPGRGNHQSLTSGLRFCTSLVQLATSGSVCNLSVHNLMKRLLQSGGQILWRESLDRIRAKFDCHPRCLVNLDPT